MVQWLILLSSLGAIFGALLYAQPQHLLADWTSLWSSAHPLVQGDDHVNATNVTSDWNLLYHLGGNSPWIAKVSGVVDETSIDPPAGCRIDQVHMVCPSKTQAVR
jgi:hypothetical protein